MASMAVTRMARRAGIIVEIRTVSRPIRAATARAGRDTWKTSGTLSSSSRPGRSPSREKVTHMPPQPASSPSGMPMSETI